MPTMHPVESSNVASIGHDGKDMHVAYKSGGVYVYKDVPVSTFQEARAADSVGGYIHAHVRDKHEVETVSRGAKAPPEDVMGQTMMDRVMQAIAAADEHDLARAVIAAMRDVDSGSPAMLSAGKKSLYSCSSDPELEDARQCWQAMIDVALEEAPLDDLEPMIGRLQTPINRGREDFEHIMEHGTDRQKETILSMLRIIASISAEA